MFGSRSCWPDPAQPKACTCQSVCVSFLDPICTRGRKSSARSRRQIARRAGRSELSQLRGRDREGKAVVMHGGVHARPGALPRIPFLPGAAPGPSSPGGRPGLGAALRRSKTKSRLHFGPPAAGDLCKRAHRVRISHPALRLSDDPCVCVWLLALVPWSKP